MSKITGTIIVDEDLDLSEEEIEHIALIKNALGFLPDRITKDDLKYLDISIGEAINFNNLNLNF